MRCLIFIGAADSDFLDRARRAAHEIPNAELLLLDEADHYAAHMSQDDVVLDCVLAVVRVRAASARPNRPNQARHGQRAGRSHCVPERKQRPSR
jgi:hypothetical protein